MSVKAMSLGDRSQDDIGARVLIVEDEIITAEDIRGRLMGAGYTVVGLADSGETALVLAEEEKPDIAIVDIMLRGSIDGVSVGQFLSEKGVAVVHLTALFERAIIEARGYAIDLLAKPFSDAELFAALAKAKRRR